MFFGPPLNGARPYHRLFHTKTSLSYLRHVFFHMSNETRGDSIQSSQLFGVYNRRRSKVFQELAEKANAQVALLQTSVQSNADFIPEVSTPQVHRFFKYFDTVCKQGFVETALSFNDYTKPIMRKVDMVTFINLAPSVFPFQWNYLCKL